MLYYSDKTRNIIPMPLILFRKGGILPLEGSDDHVYDREAGSGKVETV